MHLVSRNDVTREDALTDLFKKFVLIRIALDISNSNDIAKNNEFDSSVQNVLHELHQES